jgi:ribosomal protein S18 acetylase RimI-like enzyme
MVSAAGRQGAAQATMTIHVRSMRPGEAAFCERVLRALPEWFGIESSLVQYVRDAEAMPTFIAELGSGPRDPAGFMTLRRHEPHAPRSAEIHCIAVLPERHRGGIGRALVDFAAAHALAAGVEYLQVKTQGPSRPCEHYDRTRRFYESLGFVALEEFSTLWPGNPCLMLVRKLA